MLRLFRLTALGMVALTVALPAQAPPRTLTIDDIYDPQARVDFSGSAPTNLTWLDDDRYLVRRGTSWLRVDAMSGRTEPLFDASRLPRAAGVTLNPARTGALLTMDDDLYFHELASGETRRLTSTPGEEEEATFSPDGRRVAFVRANNLFVVEVASSRERALTTDGSAEILNGKLDWLYQEEIYGRGRFRGYWWSPDSARMAFLQLDERGVPAYTVVDQIPYRPSPEIVPYPKAGDPNPKVRLGVANVAGDALLWIDLNDYTPIDFLVVDVDWSPDAALVYQIQDREQTWLDLNVADAVSGRSRRLLRETTTAWVNVNGSPTWLADGSFLWLSERSGFKHLYHYKADGTPVRQVTSGPWDLVTLYGVDETSRLVYFASNERSAIGADIYRIGLDGAGFTRLSRTEGTHGAIFNPSFTRYVDVWSDVVTPAQVRLHRADGTELRVIDANPVRTLAEYRLARPELLRIPTRDGGMMDAMMITPPDFTPTRRYPVFQHAYSGMGVPQVLNRWGGQTYMFHQMLAQHGVIVWILDNRSASSKGLAAQWAVYGNLGELELRDLEDGIAWLKRQPYIDTSRIVLSGWSYGGFMTAYALTHSTSWAGGIVGAPVTDWRNYDTIWTERYMNTPQNNPDGYRRTAPRLAAANLSGRLLLVHGAIDDNVHSQNSEQFAYELQRAGKSFEMMIYPRSRHGITDPRLNKHLRQMMFDFVMRTVGEAPPSAATASR
ncbi:MAG: S9 family peptidase [Acidobacteria bacterium]|nr:S9 family peptidase [Acidobacteriota bacterium]